AATARMLLTASVRAYCATQRSAERSFLWETVMSMRGSPPRRRSPVVKRSNANGHGKAKSPVPSGVGADVAPSAPSGPSASQRDEEVLRQQPRITDLLQVGNRRAKAAVPPPDGALSRTQLLEALIAFRKGDFSLRLPVDLEGMDGKIADAFNDVIDQNQ